MRTDILKRFDFIAEVANNDRSAKQVQRDKIAFVCDFVSCAGKLPVRTKELFEF